MSSSELPSWAAGYLENNHIFQNAEPTAKAEPSPAAEPVASVPERTVQQAPPQQAPRHNPAPQRRGGGGPALLINDPNARIEGRFETTEEIEIGCDLTGEIVAGRLHITQSGNVSGVVHTVDAVIAGRFEGDIVATGSLEVLSGGFLGGNVQTDGLTIARGATFRGQVQQLPQQQFQQTQQFEPAQQLEPVQFQQESQNDSDEALEEPEPVYEERRATGPLIAVEITSEETVAPVSLLTPVELPIDIPHEGAA